jgi:hypothetical protein
MAFKSTVQVGASSVTINGRTFTRPAHETHHHAVDGSDMYTGTKKQCPFCKAERKAKREKKVDSQP